MAVVTINYFGMEGRGKNVTEARRAAGAKISRALTGSYDPKILSSRGTAILVYRHPHYGWLHSTIADETGFRSRLSSGTGTYEDEKETTAAALAHLAQLTWTADDGLNTAPDINLDKRQLGEFKHWAEFQLRYQAAVAGNEQQRCAFLRWTQPNPRRIMAT